MSGNIGIILFDRDGTLYDDSELGENGLPLPGFSGPLYPGIMDLLQDLKAGGYVLAMATAASQNSADKFIAKKGLSYIFNDSSGQGGIPLVWGDRPKTEILNALCLHYKYRPFEAVMVDDGADCPEQFAQYYTGQKQSGALLVPLWQTDCKNVTEKSRAFFEGKIARIDILYPKAVFIHTLERVADFKEALGTIKGRIGQPISSLKL
jgi:hypothetical protein